jgi:diadenylate cyclase
VESGTPLQARVSDALLLNIFTPYSLLHDGAAVIRGDDIVAAGVILPLTQQPVTDRSLGTRHRAALGLSEKTDARVVVVSEETGAITLAHGGRLFRNISPDELKEMLIEGPPPMSAASANGRAALAGS